MTLSVPNIDQLRKRWTADEYLAAVELGDVFQRREWLFRGEVLEMPAMGQLHMRSLMACQDWAYAKLRPHFRVRVQGPILTLNDSVPEPDVAIVTDDQNTAAPHPNRAELIIEVSDSSIALDREIAFEYAAICPEYWLLDLRSRRLEVYRQPEPDAASPSGFRYTSMQTIGEDGTLSPLCRPDVSASVRALLDG
ncbi:MAG TPA: Uma2 family endonuclease [Tepidisphaeraceae bacterium]|nr:Uma2 family endonuclease [Tepidisphaeraceae bacterium]